MCTPVDTRAGRIWVGLPPRESGLLGELVERGEIGVELCHDPSVRWSLVSTRCVR